MQSQTIKKKNVEVDGEGRIVIYPSLYNTKRKSIRQLIKRLFAIRKTR